MSGEDIVIHIILTILLVITIGAMVLNIIDFLRQPKSETEYAVQWQYFGESVWYTSLKYSSMEEAVLIRNKIRANNPMLVSRIVKRQVTKWEEV